MDEEKDLEQTSNEDASTSEEFEETTESGTNDLENQPENDLTSDNIDFEAELEKERQRLGGKIDKERQKRIEAEKSRGLSREDIEKIIEEKTSQSEKRLLQSRAELMAERLSGSSAEKDLILHHYNNSIISSGNIEEDIENSFALANRKKISGQMSELRKTAQHRKNVSVGNSDGGLPVEQKPIQRYSKEIIEGAKFAGMTPKEFVEKINK